MIESESANGAGGRLTSQCGYYIEFLRKTLENNCKKKTTTRQLPNSVTQ